jgi:tRNA(Ile)-lysidine synthase
MTTTPARRPHGLIQRVALEARRGELIRPNAGVLVAVSGGPDSVGLLAVLEELRTSRRIPGLILHAAHMNYGLRGAESDEDEDFVRDLGTQLGIPVHIERADLDRRKGGSLQAQARACRYDFFERLCRTHDLSVVATGHTADDQAETILMWLIRGCGPKGLSGIPMIREGTIIRPLLHVRRAEILDYLAARRLTYRRDSSNDTNAYQRNRIRHDLQPRLQAFNPRVMEALARTAELLRADVTFLAEAEQVRWSAMLIESIPDRVVLDRRALAQSPEGLQRRLVRRAWETLRGSSRGLTYRHVVAVQRIVDGSGDSSLNLPGGVRARRRGNHFIIQSDHRKSADADPSWALGVRLSVPGSVSLAPGSRLCADVIAHREVSAQCDDRMSFTMGTNDTDSALTVRRRLPGDWFCPIGMGGRRKKLQDFFVDQKVPRHQRDQVPLVVAPRGIVWVGGYRGDERFRPTLQTSRIVKLALIEQV